MAPQVNLYRRAWSVGFSATVWESVWKSETDPHRPPPPPRGAPCALRPSNRSISEALPLAPSPVQSRKEPPGVLRLEALLSHRPKESIPRTPMMCVSLRVSCYLGTWKEANRTTRMPRTSLECDVLSYCSRPPWRMGFRGSPVRIRPSRLGIRSTPSGLWMLWGSFLVLGGPRRSSTT